MPCRAVIAVSVWTNFELEMIVHETQEALAKTVPLWKVRGIGPEFATILYTKRLFRHFDNRRQIASYAGLAPSPWQSGNVNREQGVSKAG